jgi:VWFA-related protein
MVSRNHLCAAALGLQLAAAAALPLPAQATQAAPNPAIQNNQQTSTITVRSTLVLVPALVRTSGKQSGKIVYTLKASDFLLTDDGVPQKLTLEEDTGDQPLALVIVVQTGGAGAAHLADYRDLSPLLDNIVGSIDHKIALVGFDAAPTLLHGFTPSTAFIQQSLDSLDPGDPPLPATHGAAILDALAFAVDLLRPQPTTYRRAILLISETLDDGSHTTFDAALRALSDTNTLIYTAAFSSSRTQVRHEAAKLHSDEPGPAKGCFSRDADVSNGTDADGNPAKPTESRAAQSFNCAAELLPPLRLFKLAEIAAVNSLRRNIPETVAHLTGGEFFPFKDQKSLQRDLFTIANHVPNRYFLSFHPPSPHPGLHTLTLKLPDYPNLSLEARSSYWVDESAP